MEDYTNASATTQVNAVSEDEKTMASLSHILGIFTWIIGPLVIWLIKKDESAFVTAHSKEALNFQITLTIAYIVASALSVIGIGCLIYPVILIVAIIFGIKGFQAAKNSQDYKYPFAIRLV